MVKTTPASLDEVDPTEVLITDYIQYWENHWPESGKYSSSERAMIRAHLYFVVAKRVLATGASDVRFTKKELKQAIQFAVEVVKQTKDNDRDDRVEGDICFRYVCGMLNEWVLRDQYSECEMMGIRSRLFSEVRDRYRKSGYVDLRVTKREIQKAVDMIESIRQQKERENRLDERDRRIRQGRRKMGVLADPCMVLSE